MSDITKSFILRLPPELVAMADALAKEQGISRNEWFARMTKRAITEDVTEPEEREKKPASGRRFEIIPAG